MHQTNTKARTNKTLSVNDLKFSRFWQVLIQKLCIVNEILCRMPKILCCAHDIDNMLCVQDIISCERYTCSKSSARDILLQNYQNFTFPKDTIYSNICLILQPFFGFQIISSRTTAFSYVVTTYKFQKSVEDWCFKVSKPNN